MLVCLPPLCPTRLSAFPPPTDPFPAPTFLCAYPTPSAAARRGTDVYTDNSDVVAIAMHTGVYTPTADVPKFAYLVVAVRVLPHQPWATSSTRNGLKVPPSLPPTPCRSALTILPAVPLAGGV